MQVDKVEIKPQETGPDAPVVENQPANGENSTVERPDWLPEKFENPEALAKAYTELEKKFTQKSQTDQQPQQEQPSQDAVNEIVESAGLSMDDLTAEYEQSGQLSDESYEKLTKIGLDRKYVDGYIKGQEALSLQYQSEVFNVIGGQDKYMEMVNWAARNLSGDEINAFNNSVNGGDLEQAKMTVRGLFSRFSETEGSEPQLVKGSTSGETGSVFRSVSELTEAMKNPKYKTDQAYRQDVINKLSRSNIM